MRINNNLLLKAGSISAVAMLSAATISCSSDNVKISGSFHGKQDRMLYLEEIVPQRKYVDSVKLSSKGEFKFKYNIKGDAPEFVNLILDGRDIKLLVTKGENIKINSIYNIPGGNQITGSEGSTLVNEISNKSKELVIRIDSIQKAINNPLNTAESINKEITETYIKYKQDAIKFIVENNTSLATIVALYQRLPNGGFLFGDVMDAVYFITAADTLTKLYPSSQHVKSLNIDVESIKNSQALQNFVSSSIYHNEEVSFPELDMPDMYNVKHKLSSLKGNVILLSFIGITDKEATFHNSELKVIYDKYQDRGFEIYQVSLDPTKQRWVETVINQDLPWISVNDFLGENSQAVKNYNLKSIPANYLIDSAGDIVGKNLYDKELTDAIAKQFK